MNKKTITLVMMLLLAVVGAKADVIPSSYYSEPAAGTFYFYNVNQGKYVERLGNNFPGYTTAPTVVTLTKTANGYDIHFSDGKYLHTGYWNNQYLWTDGESGSANQQEWTFTEVSGETNTYRLSRTAEETINGKTGTFYANGTNADISPTEDCKWALITEANYYAYLASNTIIPSTYYTTTPAAGTYYLYNIEQSGFIYRGGDGNYAGLKTTPASIVLTSNGAGAFYIKFGEETKYLKTGEYSGCYVWTDATDESFAWTFESFHGVTGLFTVKCPLNDVDRYLYSSGIGARGVNAWTTPDANRTRYAWALISATDYENWQNSFVLDEATGYSATRDIYNVNPTVNRAMTANVWNTLVVPFDMAIPSGWTVKEPTAFDGSTLSFGDASSIVAGKPYLVKPSSAVTSFSATGVTLKKDLNPTTVGTGTTVTMTGTYSKIDAIDYASQDSYIVGIKAGVSSLYKVNSAVSLKPFRAYFTIPGGGASSRISMAFDDDQTTGISRIGNSETGKNPVYNLNGQRVENPKKGLYIVNGKKVVIK